MEVNEKHITNEYEKEDIVLQIHENVNGAHHLSLEATIQGVKAKGHDWERLEESVTEVFMSCKKCRPKNDFPSNKLAKLHTASLPYLWKRVNFIVLGPFSASSPKFVALLVDQYSLWVEGSYLHTCTPQALAQFIVFVSLRLGWPNFICGKDDNCLCKLVNDQVLKFKENWDPVKHKHCSMTKQSAIKNISPSTENEKDPAVCECVESGNPNQSFSVTSIDDVIHWSTFGKYSHKVENLRNRVIQLLRACPNDWERKFEILLYKYRSSSFVTEIYSPFLLMYGRNPESDDVPWKDVESVLNQIEQTQIKLKKERVETISDTVEVLKERMSANMSENFGIADDTLIAVKTSATSDKTSVICDEISVISEKTSIISNKTSLTSEEKPIVTCKKIPEINSVTAEKISEKSTMTCKKTAELNSVTSERIPEKTTVTHENISRPSEELSRTSEKTPVTSQKTPATSEITQITYAGNLEASEKTPTICKEFEASSEIFKTLEKSPVISEKNTDTTRKTFSKLAIKKSIGSIEGTLKRKRGRPRRIDITSLTETENPVSPLAPETPEAEDFSTSRMMNSSGRYSFRTKIKKKDHYGGKASVVERVHHQNSYPDGEDTPFIDSSDIIIKVEQNAKSAQSEADKHDLKEMENTASQEDKENCNDAVVHVVNDKTEEEKAINETEDKENSSENVIVNNNIINDDEDDDYNDNNGNDNDEDYQCPVKTESRHKRQSDQTRGRKLADIKPLKCPKCCSTYVTCQEELDVHLKCHSEFDKMLHCPYCDKQCQTWSHMYRHLGQHIQRNFAKLPKAWITCTVCSKTFTSRDGLNRHKRDIHQGYYRFVCSHCDRKFKDRKTFKRHLDIHADITYRCDSCKYKTKVRRNLLLHQRLHEGKAHMCETCGKGFVQQSGLNLHMMSHNDNVPKVMCEHCGLQFKGIYSLRSHVYRVHSEPQNIKCAQCEYVGRNKSNLSNHINRAHNKPLSCLICPYSTDAESALRRHMDINHSEARPLPCTQCTYRAKDTKMLAEHVRNKHDPKVRRFPCPTCQVKFKSHTQLRDHMPAHTGVKPHNCRFCDYACKYRQGLHRHMRLKHPYEYPLLQTRDSYKNEVQEITITDSESTIAEIGVIKDGMGNEQHILYTSVGEEIIVTSDQIELDENGISVETTNVTLEAVQAGIAMGIIPCQEQTEKAVELLLIAMNPNDTSTTTIVEEVQEIVES